MHDTLVEINNLLKTVFTQSQHETETRSLIESIGTRDMLFSIINEILNEEEVLSQIASMSYRHINGFVRIVLLKSLEPEYKLRLHIWWPEFTQIGLQPVEEIHNHAWSFSSAIITGGFEFQTYAPGSSQVDGMQMYHYRVGNDSQMLLQGKVHLEQVFGAFLPAGCSYSFHHSVPHRVMNLSGITTSTLLLQGAAQKTYSDIFREHPFEEAHPIPLKLTSDALATHLQSYLSVLHTSSF